MKCQDWIFNMAEKCHAIIGGIDYVFEYYIKDDNIIFRKDGDSETQYSYPIEKFIQICFKNQIPGFIKNVLPMMAENRIIVNPKMVVGNG